MKQYDKKNTNIANKNTSNKKNTDFKPKTNDDKLKPLMPTLRQKKRFLRVKIESKHKFDFKELSENIVDEIITYLGAIEFGKAGIWVLRDKFDFEKQEFIIKVSLQTKNKLCGAICLISKLGKENVKLKILRISGTIKGTLRDTELQSCRDTGLKK